MNKDERNTAPLRTNEEAWQLALDNSGLLYKELYRFVNTRYSSWYSPPAMQAELEGLCWERFFKACKRWDPVKGSLASYAVPAIHNALNEGIRLVARMGGNVKGGGPGTGGMAPQIPASLDELRDNGVVSEDAWRTHSGMEQPWQRGEDGSFEDDVVSRVDADRLADTVREIVAGMGEPHRTVFRAAHGGNGTRVKVRHDQIGETMTLRDLAESLGYTRAWCAVLLREANTYVRRQLEAKGVLGV